MTQKMYLLTFLSLYRYQPIAVLTTLNKYHIKKRHPDPKLPVTKLPMLIFAVINNMNTYMNIIVLASNM